MISSLSFVVNAGVKSAGRFSDMVLRRYLFNVDWSRKVPNIDAACRCTDVYQVSLTLLGAKVLVFLLILNLT